MAAVVTKKGKARKALQTLSSNEINVSANKLSSSLAKSNNENVDGLSLILSPKNHKKVPSHKISTLNERSLAEELKEVQKKLENLQIEKETTKELLKHCDEIIKSKEEELDNRAKEQEKLQKEIKKLQRMKEFKPTMNFSLLHSFREKEKEKNDKEKNKKKSNDCSEKKKPSSAYVLWSKDQWNEVKKENPDAVFKEISTLLGAKWKNLSTEDKKPYEEKYQQEKETYLQIVGKEKRENEAMKLLQEAQMQKTAMELLEQYLQFKQDAENKEEKKTRKEKDPLKPKKPMTAFFLFTNERRGALLAEKKNVLEISKIAGEEWKNMTEEEKAPYEEKAKLLKEEYNSQMELYRQKKIEEAATLEKEEQQQQKFLKQEALQLLKKKEKNENIIKKTKEASKKQKEEKNTDPNKPKKPASSFLLFSKEARTELLQEQPNIKTSTLSAMISVKWKELSDEQRKIWNDKAAEGMATYKREMEEYNKSITACDNDASEKMKARKEKDPLKPKKPMSAFFLFTNERRGTLLAEKKNVLEISKITGEEWKNMTEEEKAPYEEKAKLQKEEYNSQMELYQQKKMEEAATLEREDQQQQKFLKQEALQLLKKKDKTENIIKKTKKVNKKQKEEKNTDANKPKKPASSFLLFSKEARRELLQEQPNIENSTLSAMISVKWKELSDEERKIWTDKAAEGMATYKREMEEYNKSIASHDNEASEKMNQSL